MTKRAWERRDVYEGGRLYTWLQQITRWTQLSKTGKDSVKRDYWEMVAIRLTYLKLGFRPGERQKWWSKSDTEYYCVSIASSLALPSWMKNLTLKGTSQLLAKFSYCTTRNRISNSLHIDQGKKNLIFNPTLGKGLEPLPPAKFKRHPNLVFIWYRPGLDAFCVWNIYVIYISHTSNLSSCWIGRYLSMKYWYGYHIL